MTKIAKRIVRAGVAGALLFGISNLTASTGGAVASPSPLLSASDCLWTCMDCQKACKDKNGSHRSDCQRACSVNSAGCCTAVGKKGPSGQSCGCG